MKGILYNFLPLTQKTCCPTHHILASVVPVPWPAGQNPHVACMWSLDDHCCWNNRRWRTDQCGHRRHVSWGPWLSDAFAWLGREGGRLLWGPLYSLLHLRVWPPSETTVDKKVDCHTVEKFICKTSSILSKTELSVSAPQHILYSDDSAILGLLNDNNSTPVCFSFTQRFTDNFLELKLNKTKEIVIHTWHTHKLTRLCTRFHLHP